MAHSIKITFLVALLGTLLSACANNTSNLVGNTPIHDIYKGENTPGIR